MNCIATGIGSVPHDDAVNAVKLILDTFKHAPFWPQLPKINWRENMYVQYSEGMPGTVLENEKFIVNNAKFETEVESFYERVIAEDIIPSGITQEFSEGLYTFLEEVEKPRFVKGAITGPVTMGMQVTDENKKSIIYNDMMKDAMLKNLTFKARWMEERLSETGSKTLMFLDEPYMSAFGSAFMGVAREEVVSSVQEVISGIKGLKGMHCCGNTDWGLVMDTGIDVLSFDAYEFSKNLFLYPDKLHEFVDNGGIIAWGIVPSTNDKFSKETVLSLHKKFDALIKDAVKKGFKKDVLLSQSMITPACGVGSEPLKAAEKMLKVTAELSEKIRKKEGLE